MRYQTTDLFSSSVTPHRITRSLCKIVNTFARTVHMHYYSPHKLSLQEMTNVVQNSNRETEHNIRKRAQFKVLLWFGCKGHKYFVNIFNSKSSYGLAAKVKVCTPVKMLASSIL